MLSAYAFAFLRFPLHGVRVRAVPRHAARAARGDARRQPPHHRLARLAEHATRAWRCRSSPPRSARSCPPGVPHDPEGAARGRARSTGSATSGSCGRSPCRCAARRSARWPARSSARGTSTCGRKPHHHRGGHAHGADRTATAQLERAATSTASTSSSPARSSPRCRSSSCCRLPAPAGARPHRRRGEGMMRTLARSAAVRRARRGARWPRAARGDKSIIDAGNSRRPRRRRVDARRRRHDRRRHVRPAPGGAVRRRSTTAARADHAPRPPRTAGTVDHRADAARRAAAVPDRRARRRRRSPVEITFWHGLTADLRGELSSSSSTTTTPARRKVHVTLAEPGRLRADVIDKYLQSEPGQPARAGADARVHGADVPSTPSSFVPVAGVHREPTASTPRRSCPARCSAYATGACSGRCRSTSATRCCSTTRRCSPPPGSTRTSRRARSRSSQQASPADRRVAAPPTYGLVVDTRLRLRRRLVHRAVVRARPASSTPTTTTAARRRRRRCCSTTPTGVDLLTQLQRLVDDGLARSTSATTPAGRTRCSSSPTRPTPAAMTIGTSAALGTVLGRRRRPASRRASRATTSASAPMPGPGGAATVRRRRRLDRGSPPTRATRETAAAWDFVAVHGRAPQLQSTWAAATGYVPIRHGRGRRSSR